MASQGDNKIDIINGDSISVPLGVTQNQAWWRLIANETGILSGDLINVSNSGKTLRNTSGSTQSNSLLWELNYHTGNLDSPTYAFYNYSTRIHKVRIRIGANDRIQNSTTWAADVTELLQKYSTYPADKVSFISIGMMDANQYSSAAQIIDFNNISKTICQSFGVKFIDLYTEQVAKGDYVSSCTQDGLHPNVSGNIFDAQKILFLEQQVIEPQPTTFQIHKQFRIV